ncbi:MAG: RNA methyltransferase [bacterium]|nr:RNA methyltransferase [bacterium]
MITSSSNAVYKHIKALQDKKYRKKYSEYTVEGIKSVRDALNSNRRVKSVVISEGFTSEYTYSDEIEIITVSAPLFAKLCDTQTPQGIMAVIEIEDKGGFTPDLSKAYIYCDGVNDPGNLGTIIRTADAAGFGGVLLSKGTADLYSPKTVRSSMGSFFNIETVTGLDAEFLVRCAEKGFMLYGGALGRDTIDYRDADMTKPSILIVGNEANGISKEVMEICRCVKIPILGKAESLNVSVAAAILMYELVSQRT